MRLTRAALFLAVPLAAGLGVTHVHSLAAPAAGQDGTAQSATEQKATEKRATSNGFDPTALDTGADPCADFYQYACGGWAKSNPIPGDQPSWGRFHELAERNRETLRAILDRVSDTAGTRSPIDTRLGDYYAACMDEPAADALGAKPLAEELARIDALRAKGDLPALVGRLHRVGVNAFFGFGAEQDFKDATTVIATADQGGFGLPDRDYYFKDDAKSKEQRDQYVAHVQKMFTLAGDAEPQAAAAARAVLTIETALARPALTREARRDPNALYHKLSIMDAAALAPSFSWRPYLDATGVTTRFSFVNVMEPEFFKGLNTLLTSTSLPDLKQYLRWHLIHAAAPTLSSPFVQENFEFYGRILEGRTELQPRWKRCVTFTDGDLGEALGQRYVEQTFGEEGKRRMLALVSNLDRALRDDIGDLAWMTAETKKQALTKLAAFTKKIGYPDAWRDYSALTIARNDFFGNSQRANAFEHARQLAKIGKPVDRREWLMTPPTVNAYYNPLMNEIVFPAGVLQPPFFDNSMDDAVNYGAIGAVIGHEITHGFDDEGRQFDKDGNLKDWWTEKDAKEFESRAQCFVDQYGGYTAVDDIKLNGKLTLGENAADNGGLRIALMALMDALGGKTPEKVDGFTAEQRFFLGWGQIWCESRRPEFERMLAGTDPHSPGRWRVNGVVSNMPEFGKAFGCKPAAPMVSRTPQCRVW